MRLEQMRRQPMQRTWPLWPRQLLLLSLLLCGPPGGCAQRTANSTPAAWASSTPGQVVVATDGQQLVDAVRSLQDGQSLTVRLAPPQTGPAGAGGIVNTSSVVVAPLTGATLSNVSGELLLTPPTWHATTLVLEGGAGPGLQHGTSMPHTAANRPTVLDLGYHTDMTGVFAGASRLVLSNLAIVGVCSRLRLVGVGILPEWISAIQLYWFTLKLSRGLTITQVHYPTNVTIYVSRADLELYQYMSLLLLTPFAALQPYAEELRKVMANPQPTITDVTNSSITYATVQMPLASATNFTLATFPDTADDPWFPGWDGLSQLRMCGNASSPGPLLTPEQYYGSKQIHPIWAAGSAAQLWAALERLVAHQAVARVQGWPKYVLLLNNIEMPGTSTSRAISSSSSGASSTGSSPPSSVLLGNTVISGPWMQPMVWHLGGGVAPLVQLAASTNYTPALFVHQVVLQGLGAAPLAPLLAGATSAALQQYTSALPLWALRAGRLLPGQLQLHNVTLVLPPSDYAALLSAALRGAGWWTGANTTAPLFLGISKFEVTPQASPLTPSSPDILLAVYEGWGVNASNIHVQPQAPLPRCQPLPDWQVLDAVCALLQGDDAGVSGVVGRGAAIGLGVGLGVGGGLVLIVVAVVAVAVVHKRRVKHRYGVGKEVVGGAPNVSSSSGMASSSDAPGTCEAGTQLGRGRSGPSGELVSNTQRPALAFGPPALMHAASGGMATRLHATSGTSQGRPSPTHRTSASLQSNTASLTPSTSLPSPPPLGTAARAVAQNPALARLDMCHQPSAGDESLDMSSSAASPPASGPAVFDPLKSVAVISDTMNGDAADKLMLTGVLGKGTWGTVYAGMWRGLEVAVKTVLFSGGPVPVDPDKKGAPGLPYERAVTEAAVCTSVNHPNCVATYKYVIKEVRVLQEKGQMLEVNVEPASTGASRDFKLYLIQEKMASTLTEATRGGLVYDQYSSSPNMDVLTALLLDIVSGVSYLHGSNIIHGDLKADNVLIKGETNRECGVIAKLTDFGLATAIDPAATHVSNYRSGTPFYVAPEVLAEGRVTKASDMYSLGVLMWSMYTAQRPWVRSREGVYSANPAFPTLPAEGGDRELVHLIRSCLSQPQERPIAADALATITRVAARYAAPLAPNPLQGGVPMFGDGEDEGRDKAEELFEHLRLV